MADLNLIARWAAVRRGFLIRVGVRIALGLPPFGLREKREPRTALALVLEAM